MFYAILQRKTTINDRICQVDWQQYKRCCKKNVLKSTKTVLTNVLNRLIIVLDSTREVEKTTRTQKEKEKNIMPVDKLLEEITELLELDAEQAVKLAICLVSHIGEEIEDDFELSYEYEEEAEEYKRKQSR